MRRICRKCHKTYASRQSLWNHKKYCKGETKHYSFVTKKEQNQQHKKALNNNAACTTIVKEGDLDAEKVQIRQPSELDEQPASSTEKASRKKDVWVTPIMVEEIKNYYLETEDYYIVPLGKRVSKKNQREYHAFIILHGNGLVFK